jgi:transcription elongation factor GreA
MKMTLDQQIQLTQAGRARLQDEFEWLRSTHEPSCREQLRATRESGYSDDAERHMAVEELLRVQARIAELEQLLAASAVGPSVPHGAIAVGSRVTARDDAGRLHVFILVGPLEAGGAPGNVSTDSPVGAALMGRASGDHVAVKTPAGQRTFSVVSVE